MPHLLHLHTETVVAAGLAETFAFFVSSAVTFSEIS